MWTFLFLILTHCDIKILFTFVSFRISQSASDDPNINFLVYTLDRHVNFVK